MLDNKVKQWFWINFIIQIALFYILFSRGLNGWLPLIGSAIAISTSVLFIYVDFKPFNINIKPSYLVSGALMMIATIAYLITPFFIYQSIIFAFIAIMNWLFFNYTPVGKYISKTTTHYFGFEIFICLAIFAIAFFDMGGPGVWLFLPSICMLGSIIIMYKFRNEIKVNNKIK